MIGKKTTKICLPEFELEDHQRPEFWVVQMAVDHDRCYEIYLFLAQSIAQHHHFWSVALQNYDKPKKKLHKGHTDTQTTNTRTNSRLSVTPIQWMKHNQAHEFGDNVLEFLHFKSPTIRWACCESSQEYLWQFHGLFFLLDVIVFALIAI